MTPQHVYLVVLCDGKSERIEHVYSDRIDAEVYALRLGAGKPPHIKARVIQAPVDDMKRPQQGGDGNGWKEWEVKL